MNIEQVSEKWKIKLNEHITTQRLRIIMEGSNQLQKLLLESDLVFGRKKVFGKIYSKLYFKSPQFEWSIEYRSDFGKESGFSFFVGAAKKMDWTLGGYVFSVQNQFKENQDLIKDFFNPLAALIEEAAEEFQKAHRNVAAANIKERFLGLVVEDVKIDAFGVPHLCFNDGTTRSLESNITNEERDVANKYVQNSKDF